MTSECGWDWQRGQCGLKKFISTLYKQYFLSFLPGKAIIILGKKKEKQGETWKWWHGNGFDVAILFDFLSLRKGQWAYLLKIRASCWEDLQRKIKEREQKTTQNKKINRDLPGGPLGRNPPACAEDVGSVPGPGRFHMPQGNQVSLWATTTQPTNHSYWACVVQVLKLVHLEPAFSATREAITKRSSWTTTRELESSPCSLQLEKARKQQLRPSATNNEINSLIILKKTHQTRIKWVKGSLE